ncbi:uncharacterized protein LOC6560319 [Drosophila grimshawi]|uniref:GH21868 n=1 Tax=Drosophila grimshawi TaxID=7222 RepID=B4J7Q5_DROGR|nr:uncharacterized protein LOC6560319 [Drosophila grimshawi]EDW02203.1 GH21868 [Drosophila grimshawi]
MRFEPLDTVEKLYIDFRDIHVVGKERSLNGTAQILEDMDAKNFQMSVHFQHDSKRNNQWRNMLNSIPMMDVCTAMRMFVRTYGNPTLRNGENTNLPFTAQQCPLEQGTYYVKNMLMNTDNWPDIMPIGGLRGTMRFYRHHKLVGGFRLSINAERQPL